MTARDKFIVVALLTLMVVVSVVTIAMDTREARVVPAYGGTYVEGVTGVPQYLNPVIAATDVDQDIARLVFSGLTRFDRDGAIVADLGRNEDFYRTRPARPRAYLERVILRFYPDPSEALRALARGEIDGVAGLSTGDAERARTLKSVVLYSMPTNDFVALFLNVRPDHAVFRDRAVRQAIVTAIDRGRILQLATDGRGTVADEFVPPTSWAYVKDVRKYTYSVEDAKRLLEDADWKDRDGGGIREKGGVKLAFGISTSGEPSRVAAARQIASDLNAIGMKVEVHSQPFAELVEATARQRTFDALLVGISVSGDPDPYSFFPSTEASDPGHNCSGY